MTFPFVSVVLWLVALAISSLLVVIYFKWKFSYWKKKGVPFFPPKIPFGSSENPLDRKEYIGIRIKRRYDEFKSAGYKHGGLYMFTSPIYVPVDPEYIRNIMVRDFRHFSDRGMYYNEKDDPLSAHLFNLEGQKWKGLRGKLTPTFTSGKMKMMFTTIVDCAKPLAEAIEEFCRKEEPVDVKDVSSCFTTDVIGSCAFGLECNSFKNPDAEFRKYGKQIFTSITRARSIGAIITLVSPSLGRFLGVTMTPREVSRFFFNVVRETVDHRTKTQATRKDFMQLLIDLKSSDDSFTMEELTAQAYAFFLAGYETSSTTIAFCLYEMAVNSSIQERARKEIFDTLKKHGGEITYDGVMELKYMDQVIDETLRKYPPASMIPRMCVKNYTVPGTGTVIEKGTRIMIPVLGLHHDPEFYPDPDKFDPDRFSEENKRNRGFTYMPFGEGPRICIGLRFGLMQTKVGLTALLRRFRFFVSSKTKVPLDIDPTNLILMSKDGIWLDVKELTK